MAQVIRRKRKQVARNGSNHKCPKCGEPLKKMSDPEGKEWQFCVKCHREEN